MAQNKKHRRRASKCGGFTLTELMIAVGMMGVITTTLFLTLTTTQKTVTSTTQNSMMVDSAWQALGLLESDITASIPPIPPRNDHENLVEPGYAFLIVNHGKAGESDSYDELWFSTTYTRGTEGRVSTKNVRYFVDWDPNTFRHVLKRQELYDMYADPDNTDGLMPEVTDANSYTLCGAVEKFEIQYLTVMRNPETARWMPDCFKPTPEEDEVQIGNKILNFRDPEIWNSQITLHPNDESSPRAIRVILVLRDYGGGPAFYFDRVFWTVHTRYPDEKWEPEEEEEES